MANLINPGRVELGADGIYRWTAKLGRDYEAKNYELTMKVVGGLCLFMIIFSGFLSFQYNSLQEFLVTLASCAVIMLITGLICYGLDKSSIAAVQAYEMTEEHIRFVNAKSTYWDFKNVKEITIAHNYVEMKRKKVSVRVYVPVEDMDLVSGFIMTHVPLGTTINKKNN